MLADVNTTTVLDLIGTFAFAVSGIRRASDNNFDWFGAYIVGLVTAIGGGTTRDLMLGLTPFWMLDVKYIIITAVALLAALLLKGKLFRLGRTLFIFDSIGLGLFTIVGISLSLDAGLPFWVCIIMGGITGTVGGVFRDILINDIPLIFRKEIYAMASIMGGMIYFLCYQLQFSTGIAELSAAVSVIAIRVLAVKFHIHLPILKSMGPDA